MPTVFYMNLCPSYASKPSSKPNKAKTATIIMNREKSNRERLKKSHSNQSTCTSHTKLKLNAKGKKN